ncbi:MAG: glycoside hydrolase family 32 protein [Clostridium sp.]|nr:glycoside hydrolase family 32 protein [Clostridium sp.]
MRKNILSIFMCFSMISAIFFTVISFLANTETTNVSLSATQVDDSNVVNNSSDGLLTNLTNTYINGTSNGIFKVTSDVLLYPKLTNLKIDGQILTPTFSQNVYSYKTDVEFTSNKLSIRPTAERGDNIDIKVLNSDGTKFYDSTIINNHTTKVPVAVGISNIYINVKNEPITYKIQVNRHEDPNLLYTGPFRNQYHFSRASGWINDPNGLVYKDGVYHMFFQANKDSSQLFWGNMSWGQATSTDLINWTEKGIAIPQSKNQPWEDFMFQSKNDPKAYNYIGDPHTDPGQTPNKTKAIFSGSVVIDKNNTAGFGKNAMIAIYTSDYFVAVRDKDNKTSDPLGEYLGLREVQEQCLAYSLDDSKTWIKLDKPVIPITALSGQGYDSKSFRDPKVIWNDSTQKWVMATTTGQKITLFTSKNLKKWTHVSDINRVHDVNNGVWECPELFPIKVSGTNKTKWVLSVSIQQGAPAKGSGMEYYVGNFDGNNFTPENASTMSNPKYTDYGEDFYAGQTFSNIPDNKNIMLSWMSNWNYANDEGTFPTSPWRNSMTLPRELTLVKTGLDDYSLAQKPVDQISSLFGKKVKINNQTIKATKNIKNFKGTTYVISSNFSWKPNKKPDNFGFNLRESLDGSKKVTVGYDTSKGAVYIDLSKEGDPILTSDRYLIYAPVHAANNHIKLTAYVDTSSIELYINDGKKTITQSMYPNSIGNNNGIDTNNISIFSDKGDVNIKNTNIMNIENIWNDKLK